MSLRTKYLFVAGLSVLIPLLLYLLLDTLLIRSMIETDQARGLRVQAQLVHGAIEECRTDCPTRVQEFLDRVKRTNPHLEIIVLDNQSRVNAATRHGLRGDVWKEQAIQDVLDGRYPFSWDIMDHHGEPVLDVTIPWTGSDGVRRGAIHLARTLSSLGEQITAIRIRHSIFVLVAAMGVGIILSFMTYRLVIRRLGRLDRELRTTDWKRITPTNVGGGDEIERLSSALRSLVSELGRTASQLEDTLAEKDGLLTQVRGFNEELEREIQRARDELMATQHDLVRSEQLATLGRLSAGIAHELRNPLFIIRGTAEEIIRNHPESQVLARDVIDEVDRVAGVITRLLDLARPVSVAKSPVDLVALMHEVVESIQRSSQKAVQVDIRAAEGVEPRVQGDDGYLRQAFANLLGNACEAQEGPGEVIVDLNAHEGSGVRVKIRDRGIGIDAGDLPHVFEPFFTRKPGGTGLGLAITKKILDLHGATVDVQSEKGHGTVVTVQFGPVGKEDG